MVLGVVIPVYRGGDTVAGVVESLRRFTRAQGIPCRAVLVEDGSDVASRRAVVDLWRQGTGVTAVLLGRNVGQQRALYEGIRLLGDCDLIATMDDDGDHPVALLPRMIAALSGGAQLCYAVPERRSYPLYRRVGARLRDGLFTLFIGVPRGVRVSAYRIMTRELALRLTPEADGYIHLSAAALRLRPAATSFGYAAEGAKPTTYTPLGLWRLLVALSTHYTPLKCFRLRRASAPVPPEADVRPGRGLLWQS